MNRNMIINGIDNESITMYKELLEYGFEDIIFIDSDINKVKNLNDKFANTIAFYGNSASTKFLEFAGINRSNSETIFVAMTSSDSVNLISCEIAKYKYKLENVVSVVNSKENLPLFNAYGITELFFQGRSVLELIINSSGITLPISLLDIRNKGTSLWSIKIPKDSNAIGMDLAKLNLPFRAIVFGKIDSKGNPYQSTENIDIDEGDNILIITSNRNEETMTRFFQGNKNA
tara:strand:- start:607 stop:1299 length:693 start_codon:yes stop_codon:yes gene_type:complete